MPCSLGFAGAFRRAELAALNVEDLVEVADGFRVLIRRSKTDQERQGQEIAIPGGLRDRQAARALSASMRSSMRSSRGVRPDSATGCSPQSVE